MGKSEGGKTIFCGPQVCREPDQQTGVWSRSALFGRFFGYVFVAGACGGAVAIEFANRAGVDFRDRDVNTDSFLAGLNLLLVGAMAKLALDFNVSL